MYKYSKVCTVSRSKNCSRLYFCLDNTVQGLVEVKCVTGDGTPFDAPAEMEFPFLLAGRYGADGM
jgi:hypothetical protein